MFSGMGLGWMKEANIWELTSAMRVMAKAKQAANFIVSLEMVTNRI